MNVYILTYKIKCEKKKKKEKKKKEKKPKRTSG